MGKKIAFVLVTVAVVIAGTWLVSRWIRAGREEPPRAVERVPEETRSVTLYFPDTRADGLAAETREIAVGDSFEEQVKGVLAALIDGPEGRDKVSPMPPQTRVLQVFWVEYTQTVYIDFNRALTADHEGGSAGEYYTISMILRTVSANFPQVRRLQFLVDGYPVETIAGHYAVGKPLDIMRWR